MASLFSKHQRLRLTSSSSSSSILKCRSFARNSLSPAVFAEKNTRVICQGITVKNGTFHIDSRSTNYRNLSNLNLPRNSSNRFLVVSHQSTTLQAMQATQSGGSSNESMKLLFVEMGVGYDQHGQDITAASMRACRDAISSNSIPAFRRGSIPGVTFEQMKLHIKLGVPHSLQQSLDIERVKSVFPYGKIMNVEVVDGGLICSSGVHVEEMGDKNDDCYIVNAAVYIGY